MSSQPPANPPPAVADVVQSLDDLATAAGSSTLRNKILPATTGVPTIPVRIGKALSTGQPAP
jgi:hypothetical protein